VAAVATNTATNATATENDRTVVNHPVATCDQDSPASVAPPLGESAAMAVAAAVASNQPGGAERVVGQAVRERQSGPIGVAVWVAVAMSMAVSLVAIAWTGLGPLLPPGASSAVASMSGPHQMGRLSAGLVLAAGSDPGGISLDQFLTNARNVLIGLLATLTICYLTIGGIRMIIASGEPGEVERAKSALRSAAFGFIATVLAPAFVGLLQSLFGGGR